MTSTLPHTTPFFVTGGTLGPTAASYVARQSDEELYQGLREGEFCYVLTARQMGKSSLMVRTAARLRADGIGTLILDLTALGQGVSAEQWYRGLLAIAGEQLDLERELEAFWAGQRELGPLQRWFAALRQVALPHYPQGLVVFVDEIDAVRALSFRTDDFFAAIRASANGQINGQVSSPANSPMSGRDCQPEHQPEARLTFCLLGVATPADLIRDTRNTPFNIGRRIELQDFTPAEAVVFARGLSEPSGRSPRDSARLLERVLYWTAGQPYLSQRLCKAVADDPDLTAPEEVDRRCAELFFAPGALRRETHLLFAQELLLRGTEDVGGLLGLYARIRAGRAVPDDEKNPFVGLLRLSGVIRVFNGRLRLRNRIYARVFDRRWVRDHLPEVELRRQRAAFWRGALVVGTLATVVGLLLASITAAALRSEAKASQLTASLRRTVDERNEALREREGALQRLGKVLERLTHANRTLRAQQGMIQQKAAALSQSKEREHAQRLAAETSGSIAKAATIQATEAARLAERRGAETRREAARLQAETGDKLVSESRFLEALPWYISATKLEGERDPHSSAQAVIRSLLAESPRLLRLWNTQTPLYYARCSPNGRWLALARADAGVDLQPASGGPPRPLLPPGSGIAALEFSRDNSHLLASSGDAIVRIWDLASGKPPIQLSERAHKVYFGAAFVDQGQKIVTLEDSTGRVRLWASRSGQPLRDVGTVSIGDVANLLVLGNTPYALIASVRGSQVLDLRSGLVTAVGPLMPGLLAANLNGTLLAFTDGNDVSIWQMPQLTRLGHVTLNRLPKQIAFQPDGRLRTVGVDGTVQDWDPRTCKAMSEPVRLPGPAVVAALRTPASGPTCGREVFTIDPSGVARTWDLASRADRAQFLRPPAASAPPAFDPTGKLAAMPGEDGWVRVVETATGRPARAPLWAGIPLACAAFSPDGAWLAAAGYGGPPRLWNLRTGVPHPPMDTPVRTTPGDGIYALRFSPDGRRLLACRTDRLAQLYDVGTGRAQPPIPCMDIGRTPHPFSPDGRCLLLSCDAGPFVTLLKIDRERTIEAASLEGSSHGEFSPDGSSILAAGSDNTVRVWSVPARRQAGGNPLRGERLTFATYSPDGRRILTIDVSSRSASLWDSRTFRPLFRPLVSRGVIALAAFSPNGRLLAVAASNGDLEIWDTQRGRLAAAPFNAPVDIGVALGSEQVTELRFSADSSRVLAAFTNGNGLVLPVEAGPPLPERQSDLTAILVGGAPASAAAPAPVTPEEVMRAWGRSGQVLKGSPEALQATDVRWHREQWRDCERIGFWEPAVDHLSRVIEADPTSWQLRERRAQLQVQRQRWNDAAEDFQAAITRGSTHYLGYYWCALTQLAAGDRTGYQKTCARMLSQFAAAPRLRQRDLTVWTCALGPGRPADLQRAIAVTEGMLHGQPGNPSWKSTLGALYCRTGRYQEALAYLPPETVNPSGALDDLFRALAYHGLGRGRAARAALAAAEQAMAAALKPGSSANPSWEDRMEATVLLTEVRARMSASIHSTSP